MSDDIRSLIQDRLTARQQARDDAPRRRQEAEQRARQLRHERLQREHKALYGAITGAKLIDKGPPGDFMVEYVGGRNEKGKFFVVRLSLVDFAERWKLARWLYDAVRADSREACIDALLVKHGVDYLKER